MIIYCQCLILSWGQNYLPMSLRKLGCEPALKRPVGMWAWTILKHICTISFIKNIWYIRIQDNKIPYIAKSIFFQANEHNIGQNYLPISLRKYSEDSIKSPVGMEAWFMNFSTILKHVCTTIPLSRSLKIFWCIHIQDKIMKTPYKVNVNVLSKPVGTKLITQLDDPCYSYLYFCMDHHPSNREI